jgi:hypothetical protein
MLNDWPGGVILTNGSQQGQPGAESAYYYGPNSCMVSEEPLDSNQSIFFRGGGVGTCMAQAVIPYFPAYSFGTSGFALGTTVLPSKVTNDAGQSTGIKGRLNFSQGGTPPYDVITIYDSLPETTAVTPSTGQLGVNRPLADAGDGAICLDGASSNSGSVCLRGQAINFYLNRLADGTSWAMGMSDLFYSTSTALAGGIQIRVPFGTGTSGNTDNAGAGTLSSGSPDTFGYTFTGTYVSAPICVATDTLHPLAVQATSTTTRLTVTGTGSDTINYVCIARN